MRPAARDLSGLDLPDKEAALKSLSTLATGIWSGHDVKHLSGQSIPKELSLYESKFGKGARIIWTIGIDFIPLVSLYQQTIRVWAVDRNHDDAQRSIQRVCAIHRRGLTSIINRKLRSRVQRVKGTDVVLPKTYEVAPDGALSLEALQQHYESSPSSVEAEADEPARVQGDSTNANAHEELTVRYPPAVEQEDAYNLVKFYTLERSLVYSILAATFTDKLEFPFLPDEAEHLIISLSERRSVLLIGRSRPCTPDPVPCPHPASHSTNKTTYLLACFVHLLTHVLIGRSGTGKTTIVVQRMWLKFRTHVEAIAALDGGTAHRVEAIAVLGGGLSGASASSQAGVSLSGVSQADVSQAGATEGSSMTATGDRIPAGPEGGTKEAEEAEAAANGSAGSDGTWTGLHGLQVRQHFVTPPSTLTRTRARARTLTRHRQPLHTSQHVSHSDPTLHRCTSSLSQPIPSFVRRWPSRSKHCSQGSSPQWPPQCHSTAPRQQRPPPRPLRRRRRRRRT